MGEKTMATVIFTKEGQRNSSIPYGAIAQMGAYEAEKQKMENERHDEEVRSGEVRGRDQARYGRWGARVAPYARGVRVIAKAGGGAAKRYAPVAKKSFIGALAGHKRSARRPGVRRVRYARAPPRRAAPVYYAPAPRKRPRKRRSSGGGEFDMGFPTFRLF